MTGATLFSGIGAPEVAMPWVKWRWCAENERFPSLVLRRRHPKTVNLGDVTKPDFVSRAKAYGPINLLVAGAPCQDYSIAGQRAGMGGERGSLSLRFLDIVDALRPDRLLFENVPGLFTSTSHAAPDLRSPPRDLVPGAQRQHYDYYEAEEGSDFGALLSGLSDIGYPGLAWTVLDAQYFGLAQRRERVFIVGSLRGWRDSAAILFDEESLSGDSAPLRAEGEGFTHGVAPGLTSSGRGVERAGESRGQDPVVAVAKAVNGKGGTGRMDATSETLLAFDSTQITSKVNGSNPKPGDPCPPLMKSGHPPKLLANSGRNQVEQTFVPILEAGARTGKSTDDLRAGLGIGEVGDPMYTLQSGKHHAVAFSRACPLTGNPYGDDASREDLLIAHTLRADGFDASGDGSGGCVQSARSRRRSNAGARAASGGSSNTYVGVRRPDSHRMRTLTGLPGYLLPCSNAASPPGLRRDGDVLPQARPPGPQGARRRMEHGSTG